MDKTWMHIIDTTSDEYIIGAESFLNFAYRNNPPGDTRIYCPCIDCRNRYLLDRQKVKTHCIYRGFNKEYDNWTRHGESYVYAYNEDVNQEMADSLESSFSDDGGKQMIWEATGMTTNMDGDQPRTIEEVVASDEFTLKFFKLLKYAESPLYSGCEEFTSLQFIVELMHLKVTSKWTNKSFTSLLKILKRAMSKDAKLPNSYREANKMASDMGFGYETIDVCPNHCMIYRNESSNLSQCDICSTSRYVDEDNKKAAKKVRYFSLKPRLQRLFWSSKTASLMSWHAEERMDDGIMRHPADSPAWKKIDQQYPTFASDSRNVRLALATDGFNPFGMNNVHSTWPVVLMTYNSPPNLCTKPSFFMLSILIEGPKGPGDKLDVYLQLLIEELEDLWENGLSIYNASKNEMFTLYAMLLWTISDFPVYAMLSGWSTKGEFACPRCNRKTQSTWLVNGCKWCYTGHRRFLKLNHKFQKEKKAFNGRFEMRGRPKVLLGSEVLQQVKNLETVYKKEDVIKKKMREIEDHRNNMPRIDHWKKKKYFS